MVFIFLTYNENCASYVQNKCGTFFWDTRYVLVCIYMLGMHMLGMFWKNKNKKRYLLLHICYRKHSFEHLRKTSARLLKNGWLKCNPFSFAVYGSHRIIFQ